MRAVIALSSPDRGVAEGSAGVGGWARMADRLRARAVIEDEIAALAPHQTGDDIGAPPGEAAREVGEFRRSAREALRWLLVGGPGPLLAEVDVPGVRCPRGRWSRNWAGRRR